MTRVRISEHDFRNTPLDEQMEDALNLSASNMQMAHMWIAL
jgi:hypothetical protein